MKNRPLDFRRLGFAAAAIAGCVFSAAAAVRATPGGFIGGKAAATMLSHCARQRLVGDAGDYASAADSDDWHNAFSIWF